MVSHCVATARGALQAQARQQFVEHLNWKLLRLAQNNLNCYNTNSDRHTDKLYNYLHFKHLTTQGNYVFQNIHHLAISLPGRIVKEWTQNWQKDNKHLMFPKTGFHVGFSLLLFYQFPNFGLFLLNTKLLSMEMHAMGPKTEEFFMQLQHCWP